MFSLEPRCGTVVAESVGADPRVDPHRGRFGRAGQLVRAPRRRLPRGGVGGNALPGGRVLGGRALPLPGDGRDGGQAPLAGLKRCSLPAGCGWWVRYSWSRGCRSGMIAWAFLQVLVWAFNRCPDERSLSRASCSCARHQRSADDLFRRNLLRVFRPGVRE